VIWAPARKAAAAALAGAGGHASMRRVAADTAR